jgi:Zn-dependent protease
MEDTLLQAAALIPSLIIAIVFHEVAHGWTALLLGDPTAHDQRRLSLNPLRHVDPIGTVLLPGFLAMVGSPIFGWAKPVPVNFRRLRNPRAGMMAVAAAGPATNLVLAAVGAVLLGLLIRFTGGEFDAAANFAALAFDYFILINIFLALFNLLPIPPFDGSHIVEGALPRDAARAYARLRPFGLPLLFVLLLVIPYFFPEWRILERVLLPPVMWARDHYYDIVVAVAGG